MSLTVSWRVESSTECLASLEAEWRELADTHPAATPFQSYDWVIAWLSDYAFLVASPWILLCHDDEGRLVGVAPMYLRRWALPWMAPKTLAFVGTAEPEHCESCAEYMDILCRRGWREACLDAFTAAVKAEAGLRTIELSRMNPVSSAAIASPLSAYFPVSDERSAGYRFLISPQANDSLGLSRRHCAALRRKMRRFLELPGARIRHVERPEDLDACYQALVDLHQKRWVAADQRGVFASPVFRRFHQGLQQRLVADGGLLLLCLEAEGRPLVVLYCLIHGDTCYFYQSGVDHDAYPRLSLGNVAHLAALEHCVGLGLKHYDLMAGGKNGYKARFVAPQTPSLTTQTRYRSVADRLLLKLIRRYEHIKGELQPY